MRDVARRPDDEPAPSGLRLELAALAVLLLLVVAFNPGLTLYGRVLGGYDAFVYFYPLRSYVVETLGQGRLPLWNPYLFAGSPYLANPQTAIFYPGTWLFALLDVPRAYALNFVGHLWLAGLAFYGFARVSLGMGRLAGVVGGAAFAFSGFMNGQAGHINQFSVAAWLPAVALALDLAARAGRVLPVAGLVVGLTLQILAGHPQQVYMTVAALGVVAVWRGVALARGRTGLPRRVVCLARGGVILVGAAAAAGGIAAVQLLPTLELSRLSIRGGGLTYQIASFDALPWPLLLPALLPGYWSHLPTTEFFGHLGTVLFAVAWLGLLGGAARSALLGAALVTLGLLLAVGDATPAYHLLFDWAPGFSSFRVPARWLLVSTFGLAVLAAAGVDWLIGWSAGGRAALAALTHQTGPVRAALAGAAVPLGLAALVVLGQPQSRWLLLVWGALVGGTVAAAIVVLLAPTVRRPAQVLLVAAALVDLWVAGMSLEHRHPVPNVAYGQVREATAELQARAASAGAYRSLSIATPEYVVKESGEYEERFAGLPRLTLENLLVTVKWNETLWPNVPMVYRLASADGYDGGVLPLRTYYELTQAMLGAERARPDGVLASRLDAMPAGRWLDMLGVRWVLASRVKDDTRGAVYYDRAVTVTLRPGETLRLSSLPLGEFTKLGMISSTAPLARPGRPAPGSSPEAGAGDPAGVLRLVAESGQVTEISLMSGQHTAPADWRQEQAPSLERVEGWSAGGLETTADWIAEIEFPRQSVAALEIVNTSAGRVFHIRSLNLIDDGRQMAFPLTPDSRVERLDYFDVKLYDRHHALPRAHLVDTVRVLDDAQAAARLSDPSFNPGAEAILAPSGSATAMAGVSLPGSVVFEADEAEYVRLAVHAPSDSYLILSDSWFPGWVATVDGVVAPVERANLLFRAVRLAPGDRTVEFRYAPQALRVGAAVSAVALVLSVLVLAYAGAWQRRRAAREAT